MKDYCKDALNFKGMKKKKKEGKYLCPVCKGFGGWILTEDAYGKGRHFQAFCSQCNGWGWVDKEDKVCVHEMVEVRATTDCQHWYKCKKCGRERYVDSSG